MSRRAKIIKRRNDDLVCRGLGYSRARRVRLGKLDEPGREQARYATLVGTVIRALEFQDFVAACKGARDTLAVHSCLRAGSTKTHLGASRAEATDLLGERKRRFGHVSKICPKMTLTYDSLSYYRMRVTHQGRSPTHREIQVTLA